MRRILKQALSMFLAAAMIFTAAPLSGFIGIELPDGSFFGNIASKVSDVFDSFAVKASAATSGCFTYTLSSDNKATISRCAKDTVGTVEIPAEIDGYPVIALKSYAFDGCASVTDVSFPESINRINEYTFRNCTSLQNINLGSGITVIYNYSFIGCTALKTIDIPDSVTTISTGAFKGCTALENFTLGEGITSISGSNFDGCTALKTFETGNALKSISNKTFINCTALETVRIGSNLTSISSDAFEGCSALKSFEVDEANTSFSVDENGVLFNKDKTTLFFYPVGNKNTSYIIPSYVTKINDKAFMNAVNLTEITIPDSVATLGQSAFSYCTGAETLSIGSGLTSLPNSAFSYCESLKELVIPETITGMNTSVFRNCTSLESVTIPESITKIPSYTFTACSSLKSVEFHDRLTDIGDYSFESCLGLTSITIPENMKSMGRYAFYKCSNISEIYFNAINCTVASTTFYDIPCTIKVTFGPNVETVPAYIFNSRLNINNLVIPGNVKSIGKQAFGGSYIYNVVIESGVETIGDMAFQNCQKLESISIADTVTSIGTSAFSGTSMLKSFEFPKKITVISKNVLTNSAVENVTIPDSVTEIQQAAFNNCTKLKSIDLPESVTTLGTDVFLSCSKLESINIPSGVTAIPSGAFNNTALKEITLPNGVTSIGQNAFRSTDITYIDLPDSLKTIGNNAFRNCEGLTEIVIPGNVETVGDEAFCYCYGLKKVTVENGVKSIGEYAFGDCTSLTEVTLPSSMTKIEHGLFEGCKALTDFVIPDSITSIGHWAFGNCTALENIEIPDEVTEIGVGAFSGSGITEIILPPKLTIIESQLFMDCPNLSKVVIPNGVTSMGMQAFSWCDSLKTLDLPPTLTQFDYAALSCLKNIKTIEIPEGTEIVSEEMFAYSYSLEDVILPSSIISISYWAFWECHGLKKLTLPKGVVSIDWEAFPPSLAEIEIPSTVTIIDESAFSLCPNVTIYGEAGSYAETFAQENGFYFSVVGFGQGNGKISVNFDFEGNENPYFKLVMVLKGKTDNQTYKLMVGKGDITSFRGVYEKQAYSLTLESSNGLVFGSIDTIEFGESNDIDVSFENLLPRVTAELSVKNSLGDLIESGVTISWFDENGIAFATGKKVNDLIPGTKLYYDITLSDTLASNYVAPERQSVTIDESGKVELTLEFLPEITVSGIVSDSEGYPIANASVNFVQQLTDKNTFSKNVKTDSDGSYSATVKAVGTTNITVSKVGYKTFKHSEAIAENKTLDVTVERLESKSFPITIVKNYIGSDAEETVYLFNDIEFTVSVNGTINADVYFDAGRVYIPESVLSEGSKISVTAKEKSGDFADATAEIKYSENADNKIELAFIQKGRLIVEAAELGNIRNMVLIFNKTSGKRINTVPMSDVTATVSSMENGEYTAVIMGTSSFLQNISEITQLSKYGLEEKTDYVKKDFKIETGKTEKISNVKIPTLDESKMLFTNPTGTSLSVDTNEVCIGQNVLVTARYEFYDADVHKFSDVVIDFTIPENCTVVPGNVSVNGYLATDYSYQNNVLSIPVDEKSAIIRFYVTISSEAESTNITATLSAKNNGETLLQPIGSEELTFLGMDIYVPEKVSKKTFRAIGKTLPRSTVEIYCNDVLAATTTSNMVGSFYADVELKDAYNYAKYNIYAKIVTEHGVEIISQTETVSYIENCAEVSNVRMISENSDVVFDFLNPTLVAQSYNYCVDRNSRKEHTSFTFIVEFINNENNCVGDVVVVTENDIGHKNYISTEYDEESGKFIGTAEIPLSEAPESIYVTFNDFYNTDLSEPEIVYSREEINKTIEELQTEIDAIDKQFEIEEKELEDKLGMDLDDLLTDEEKAEIEKSAAEEVQAEIQACMAENGLDSAINELESGLTEIASSFANYNTNYTYGTCDGLTPEQLLADGFEETIDTQGNIIYVKNTDNSESVADFVSNVFYTVSFEEISMMYSSRSSSDGFAALSNALSKAKDIAYYLYDIYNSTKYSIDNMVEAAQKDYFNVLNVFYPDVNNEDVVKELLTKKEVAKQKLLNLEKLQKYMRALDVLSIIDTVMTAWDYGNQIRNLFLRLESFSDPECDQQKEPFENVRNDLRWFTGFFTAYIAGDLTLQIMNLVAAFSTAPATGGASLIALGLISSTIDFAFSMFNRLDANIAMISNEISIMGDVWKELCPETTTDLTEDNSTEDNSTEDSSTETEATTDSTTKPTTKPTTTTTTKPSTKPTTTTTTKPTTTKPTTTKPTTTGKPTTKPGTTKPGDPDAPTEDPQKPNGDKGRNSTPKPTQKRLVELPIILDPSGFVCEAVFSNRIEGVTVTCYYSPYEDGRDAVVWDAEEFDQMNPLLTDKFGHYEWFVPEGWWQVKYEKEGYVTGYSEWLPVPPPQMEVHYSMTSLDLPTVENVNVYADGIEIRFSQYMDISSINSSNIVISQNGTTVEGKFYPLDAEDSFKNKSVEYATAFKFVPDDTTELSGKYQVEINAVSNYAGNKLAEKTNFEISTELRAESISATETASVEFKESGSFEVQILPVEAGANKKIILTSSNSEIVALTATELVADENGKIKIPFTGLLPGDARIEYTVEGTEISGSTTVSVGSVIGTVKTVKASIESGSTVEEGAQVEFRCDTPGAQIYYTTDLSCPCVIDNPARKLYTGPITLTEDVIFITYAIKDGMNDSDTKGYSYTVKPQTIPVTGVTIDFSESNLMVGKTLQLKASVIPSNADNQEIIWSSSNGSIAKVDENGLVTAISPGSVEIKAESAEGSYYSVRELTITSDEFIVKWIVEGNVINEEKTKYGALIVKPENPKLDGYEFTGWTPEVPATMPACDLTFTAAFTAHSYDATFDANGGAWSDGDTTKTVPTLFGSKIYAPEATPVKQGYVFAGWAPEVSIMDCIDGKNFVAEWNPATDTPYVVETYTMNTSGEYEKAVENLTGTTDETANTSPAIGNGFALDTEKSVLSGKIAADGSLILKVYINRKSYTVTTIVDGSSVQETYLYGETVAKPSTPEKYGYSFIGWNTEIPEKMPADDIIVTALWKPNSYEAIFNANGGAWSDGLTQKTFSVTYDSEIAVPVIPVKQGYIFSGWIFEGANIGTNLGIMDSVNGKTYTAAWIAATDTVYTVETYTMNTEGEYSKSVQTFSGTTDSTVNAEYKINDGFSLNTEKSVLSGTVEADNSLVLKVYLDRNTYTFTTVVDGVSMSTTYLYGSIVSEPVTPTKANYKFIKWNSTVPETMPAENVTITAVFEKYYVCPDCGNEILGEGAINNHIAEEQKSKIKATIKIKNNSGSKTIKYGENLMLTAIVTDKPADATIVWYVDSAKKGEGETFNVSFESGTKTVEVKLVDSDGNVIKNASDDEVKDSETVTVKAGFFQKLISFFKNLFRINRTVVQAIIKRTF